MEPQHRRFFRLFAAALVGYLVLAAGSAQAQAQPVKVQRPGARASSPARTAAIRKARAQRVKPEVSAAMARHLDHQLASHGPAHLDDAEFRDGLASAPLQARLEVFKNEATRRGHPMQVFQRRLRGMLKNGATKRVATPMKTFFEVTEATFDLLPKVMGENVIWFAVNESPYHLHTLLADQDGGPNVTHNTYGNVSDPARISTGQYLAPALLTGPEMDRFLRYFNAAADAPTKTMVYGFKASSGQYVLETRCTNWATTAPIGDLHRWIRTLDTRVARAAAAGDLPANFTGGLHAALAAAETPEQRAALVAQVSAAPGMSKLTRSFARRLGKEFTNVATRWPNRPLDLVGRESLAEVLGVARSQDPAKWSFDLAMSKRVPVIGFTTQQSDPEFSKKVFDYEMLGSIEASGDVVGNYNGDHGVVPADRRVAPAVAPTSTP